MENKLNILIKYILLTSVFSIVCVGAYAASDLDNRRAQIISIINEELNEVQRLSKRVNGRDPDLLLRMAELSLEKARLYREKENASYLALSAKKRRKINKKRYFSKSSSFYRGANNYCLKITRKFKNYRQIADVYYILGFNAKEAGKHKTAAKYLALSTKKTKKNSVTKMKSQISLAEIYYNQKKYKKAIPLYESALKKLKDKWWTKDSFNLAWCYFRNGQRSKAISKMEELFHESSKSKYVDVRTQVERDIGMFYATSGQIDRGIRFYKKIGVNFVQQLLRISQALQQQGKFDQAAKVLVYAEKYEKDAVKLSEVYVEQINLYDKSNKMRLHLATARKLLQSYKKGILTPNRLKTFKLRIEKRAALLQRQVVSKTYKRLKKQRAIKANQAIEYFHMLSTIDKKRSHEFLFLKAETLFLIRKYNQAYHAYKTSFEINEKKKISKFKQQNMNGMLAVLTASKRRDPVKNIYVFEAYLRHWPRGKKAKSITTRLFKNYFDQKKYTKAKKILDVFAAKFPKDYKKQEAMLSNLMEVSRKKRDHDAIRGWISLINKGQYKISSKYKRKLLELLTSIQIDQVQSDLKNGNKSLALKGYHLVLKDQYSTKKAKINAKYNLALLYYELGNTDKAYAWSTAAIEEMGTRDVNKFATSFITIANYLFSSLEFKKSAALSLKYLNKICSKKTSKKQLAFKNSVFIYLAEHDTANAQKVIRKGQKCKITRKNILLAKFQLMKEYKALKKWPQYESLAIELGRTSTYYAKVIDDYINLESIHKRFGNNKKVKMFKNLKMKNFYKAQKKNKEVSIDVLDHMAEVKLKKMYITKNKISLIRLKFPEKHFNKSVQKKLKYLTLLTDQASDVQSFGSGRGIVKSFKILENTHADIAKELRSFTPKGKKKDYIKSFKKSMNDLARSIASAGISFRQTALKTIKKNKIFSRENMIFQDTSKTHIPVEFFGQSNGLIMDRGGK